MAQCLAVAGIGRYSEFPGQRHRAFPDSSTGAYISKDGIGGVSVGFIEDNGQVSQADAEAVGKIAGQHHIGDGPCVNIPLRTSDIGYTRLLQ